MEFHHREEFLRAFNLDLSNKDLWDLVKTGRLQPFKKVLASYPFPTDPISNDPAYEPLFPKPIADKYERLRNLHSLIFNAKQFLSKNEDELWQDFLREQQRQKLDPGKKEGFLKHIAAQRFAQEEELSINLEEVAELQRELTDIPGLYQKFITNSRTDLDREVFVEKLNDAYYRRDQIESVTKAQVEDKGLIRADQQPHKAKSKENEYFKNPAFMQLIKDYDHDILIVWKGIVNYARSSRKPIGVSKVSELQRAVKDRMQSPEYNIKGLKAEDFVDNDNFLAATKDSANPKRYFRETLLQEMIRKNTPKKDIKKSEIRKFLRKTH